MNMTALIAGIVASVSWGTVFVFGQVAVDRGHCNPVLLSFVRFASASVFLVLYMVLTRARFFLKKEDIPAFLVLGATGIFGMNVLIFYSLKFTTSTITSLLMNANAFIIGILASFLLKEKLRFMEVVGIIAGIAGCYLIFTQGRIQLLYSPSVLGNTLAALASCCWGFYTVWSKKTGIIDRYGAVLGTLWASLFGTAMMFLALLFMRVPLHPGILGLTVGIYLGIVPAGIGFTLWFFSISRLKTVIPGILQFLAPLTTALIASCWLREKISFHTVMGGMLIIVGVLLSFHKASSSKPEKPEAIK